MFSSWDNFLKVAGENVDESENQEEEDQEVASSRRDNTARSNAKEACSLM